MVMLPLAYGAQEMPGRACGWSLLARESLLRSQREQMGGEPKRRGRPRELRLSDQDFDGTHSIAAGSTISVTPCESDSDEESKWSGLNLSAMGTIFVSSDVTHVQGHHPDDARSLRRRRL